MREKKISSPTELESDGLIRIRGRILGSGKIGKRPGLIAVGICTVLVALIIYGVAHSGIHRPTGASRSLPVAVASESNDPWWKGESDAVVVASPAPPSRSTAAGERLPVGVPDLSQVESVSPTPRFPHIQRQSAVLAAAAHPFPVADIPPIPPIAEIPIDAAVPSSDVRRQTAPVPDEPDVALRRAFAAPVVVEGDQPSQVSPEQTLPIGPHPNDPISASPLLAAMHPATSPTIASESSRTRSITPFALLSGTVIPAALITAIDSDTPGTLMAEVRQNTYDTATGRYLLIPQGARLVGTYGAHPGFGQERLEVAWSRLIYPDGSSSYLGQMNGADIAGRSGFDAQVDAHTGKLFKGAFLMSVIGAGAQLSPPQRSSTNGSTPTVGQAFAESADGQITTTATQVVQRQLNVSPNLRVPPGYQFNVIVDRDVVLSAPYGGP